MPHETAAVSAQVQCTPYNHAPYHFMQSHIRKVHACLAVTCHMHFWQNDQDLLHATAVTRVWNRYQNKSQHRKSTLEKKILLLLLPGFETTTFQSRVWHLTTELSLPCVYVTFLHAYTHRGPQFIGSFVECAQNLTLEIIFLSYHLF